MRGEINKNRCEAQKKNFDKGDGFSECWEKTVLKLEQSPAKAEVKGDGHGGRRRQIGGRKQQTDCVYQYVTQMWVL